MAIYRVHVSECHRREAAAILIQQACVDAVRLEMICGLTYVVFEGGQCVLDLLDRADGVPPWLSWRLRERTERQGAPTWIVEGRPRHQGHGQGPGRCNVGGCRS